MVLQFSKDNTDIFRDRLFRYSALHPRIHAIGNKLTLQNSRSLQENLRWLYIAFHHIQRIRIEVQIMRSCSSNSQR